MRLKVLFCKQLFPNEIPKSGLVSNKSNNCECSVFKGGYYLAKRIICLSKGGIVSTINFLKAGFNPIAL
jgi:hypothetical protein